MLPGLVGGLAFGGLLIYVGFRYLRGDWSAASIEDRPEDTAYDEEDDGWDDDDPDRP
ncbi:MAG: hypothetical protein AAF561_06010 [Planctomycetota bacterium]